ncbi:MAG: polysaccharide biosynthesis protein, partial [Clostridia bacterium]|nr:polysaccharide biosynthesis protein [Clostridia bacterium]
EIYALFCIIATAGLPVALSVLISGALARGERESVKRIWRSSLFVFLIIGTLGTALMCLFARQFCAWIKSESAYLCILSISPTVFFICLSSAVRGYFQGYQKMLPTAVSQILEAVGKLVFGLLFAHIALEQGKPTEIVAAAAGWGLSVSTALSTLYLLIEKWRADAHGMASEIGQGNGEGVLSYRQTWKTLAKLAIPMTLGASLVSLTKLVDMTMILRRLQSIGYSEVGANEAYGSYTTLALSVFTLLPTLLNSIALPLVPMLSAAIASGDRVREGQMIETSYRLTAFFAIPASLGISAFARPVLNLLFGNEPEAVEIAAPLLSMLGASVFLSCMITATNSVLHAYKEVNRPILSMIVGAGVKVISAYFLIGNPSVALLGAPISTFLCNAVVVLLNLHFASGLGTEVRMRDLFLRPLLLSGVSIGISLGVYSYLERRLGADNLYTLSCILLAAVLYCLLGLLFGAFSKEDLASLPFGEKLCHALEKLKLIPKEKKSD